MMNVEEVKEGMKRLWKEVFHDSEEYVNLIFDNYFNYEKSFYREEEGWVIAMLIFVPYTFVSLTGTFLRGLYLCGVATAPAYRRKGLMGGLLEEVNSWAREQGYDFTFLIPSDATNRLYYTSHGYYDAFYKKDEYYVKDHKFSGNGNNTVEEFENSVKNELIEFVVSSEISKDNCNDSYSLLHSVADWEAVLRESEISGGEIILTRNQEGKLSGVAFIIKQSVSGRCSDVVVKKLYGREEAHQALLKYIKEKYPEKGIIVIRDLAQDGESDDQLWQPFYAQNNSIRSEYEDIAEVEMPYGSVEDSYPFGMIRIADVETFLSKTGLKRAKSLQGLSNEELLGIVLRPAINRNDELKKLLDLPELNFSISLLLE